MVMSCQLLPIWWRPDLPSTTEDKPFRFTALIRRAYKFHCTQFKMLENTRHNKMNVKLFDRIGAFGARKGIYGCERGTWGPNSMNCALKTLWLCIYALLFLLRMAIEGTPRHGSDASMFIDVYVLTAPLRPISMREHSAKMILGNILAGNVNKKRDKVWMIDLVTAQITCAPSESISLVKF